MTLSYEVLKRCLPKRLTNRMHLAYGGLALPSSLERNDIVNHHPLLHGALERQIDEILLFLKSKVNLWLYKVFVYASYVYRLLPTYKFTLEIWALLLSVKQSSCLPFLRKPLKDNRGARQASSPSAWPNMERLRAHEHREAR